MQYRVIDTIGLGGTALTKISLKRKELLEKFEEEIGTHVDEGISQIFLVMDDGNLSEKILTEFLWLNEFFFEKKAFDFTTIIRNKFSNF